MRRMFWVVVVLTAGLLAPSWTAMAVGVTSLPPSTVTIGVTSSEVEAGTTVTIRGRVTPRHKGDPVVLQKRVHRVWQVVAHGAVRGKGGYDFSEVVGRGTTPYRVKAPRVDGARAARSTLVRVTGVAPPVQPLTSDLLAEYQSRMLAHLNDYRAEHDLPPLTMTPEGNAIAQAHAEEGYSSAEPRPLLERFGDITAVPGLFAGGVAAVCEGRDYTPRDGPDRSENTNYLIDANTAAVGYYYDETVSDARQPVWIIHVFSRPTAE